MEQIMTGVSAQKRRFIRQPAAVVTVADVAPHNRGRERSRQRPGLCRDDHSPALITTTSIRDAAKIMTARHFRHLPVADDAGLAGVADITDVCRALINAEDG